MSEPIGNSPSVVFGLFTTELFYMIIRGITSLSDHSGKSAGGDASHPTGTVFGSTGLRCCIGPYV